MRDSITTTSFQRASEALRQHLKPSQVTKWFFFLRYFYVTPNLKINNKNKKFFVTLFVCYCVFNWILIKCLFQKCIFLSCLCWASAWCPLSLNQQVSLHAAVLSLIFILTWYFFPQSCHKIVNFLCLQMNILAVLFFSDLLKKQGKLWMMHTSTPEKSELIS